MVFKIRQGATLLELVVSIAVGAIIFVILGMIFLAQGQFFAIQDAIAETQLESFEAIDAMSPYMASANTIVASRTINGTAYATSDTLVILKLPSIDSGDDIITNTFDHVALGQDPSDATRFIVDLETDVASSRTSLTHRPSSLVDKVIFRYNDVDETAATAIEFYIRTIRTVRGNTITMPLGKTYFLGAS